jgi:hypothetical protein
LEDAAYSALGKGLNYAVSPAVLPTEDFLTGAEKAIVSLCRSGRGDSAMKPFIF